MRWNKSHLSKQVVIITYTLKKNCFAIATFEGLGVISFQPESKNVWYTWSVRLFFRFPEKVRSNEYLSTIYRA